MTWVLILCSIQRVKCYVVLCRFKYSQRPNTLQSFYKTLPKNGVAFCSLIFEPTLLANTEQCQSNTTQSTFTKQKQNAYNITWNTEMRGYFALSLTVTTERQEAKDLARRQAELSQRLATVVLLNTKSQNTVHYDMCNIVLAQKRG